MALTNIYTKAGKPLKPKPKPTASSFEPTASGIAVIAPNKPPLCF